MEILSDSNTKKKAVTSKEPDLKYKRGLSVETVTRCLKGSRVVC